MAKTSRLWLIPLLLYLGIEVVIYHTVDSWQTQISHFLLAVSILIPILITSIILKQQSFQQDIMIKQYSTLEEKHHQLYNLMQKTAPVFSLDVQTQNWFASENISDLMNSTKKDSPFTITDFEEKIHPDDRQNFQHNKESWLAGIPSSSIYRIVRDNEQIRWIEIRTNLDFTDSGNVKTIYGIVFDVTRQKEKEEELAQMAFYDALTKLPNRTMLKSHLRKVLARAKRRNHDFTIMFIDLDGFKAINDTLGHDTGDELLKEVANRLMNSVREEDLISRIGGDEFIVVIEETDKDEIVSIADRILTNISASYTFNHNTMSVTPSIGISTYPDDGLDNEKLITNADKAMYLAKENGKANYQFYTSELDDYQQNFSNESFVDKFLKLFQIG